jgi:hypothetical protein
MAMALSRKSVSWDKLSTPTHNPTYNPTEFLDNDNPAGGYGDVVDGKVSTPTSVFPLGHPLAELSGYAAP